MHFVSDLFKQPQNSANANIKHLSEDCKLDLTTGCSHWVLARIGFRHFRCLVGSCLDQVYPIVVQFGSVMYYFDLLLSKSYYSNRDNAGWG